MGIFAPVCAMASDMLPAGGYYKTQTNNCDMAAMRRVLDNATADRRAVITVVTCDADTSEMGSAYDYISRDDMVMEYADFGGDARIDCAAPIERVVARRTYVEETVRQYRPVVSYVPTGAYIRTRRVCNECDM